MQDLYVGDIGDFGKYGLLRVLCGTGLKLAVNWYKVEPARPGKQNDGKYTDYLSDPEAYRHYDGELFDVLHRIVVEEQMRTIGRVERSGLLCAAFYAEPLLGSRSLWHRNALESTRHADIVFLDPDNGLETERMHRKQAAGEKHVKWDELKDYYDRGQSVVLYQHRPQMTKKEDCIRQVLDFGRRHLAADAVEILAFPKYTNRFYFFFTHQKHLAAVREVCDWMDANWQGLCSRVGAEAL